MNEKEFFTHKRNYQLGLIDRIGEIEDKWKHYCFTPLDIPRFDYPEIVDWFFERCKPTIKLESDVATPVSGMSSFNAVDVTPTGEIDQQDIWTLNIQQDFLDLFPDVYKRILEDFPFKSVSRIRFWSSTMRIAYHRDHTRFLDFPGAFRIALYDENLKQTLGIIKSLPDTPDNFTERFMIPRLPDTNSFVWNNLRVKHGSRFENRRKILIILDRYELDVDRYNDLLERSINKYQEHVLTSNNPTSDYVDLQIC